MPTLLADLVATATAVGATRSRKAKVTAIAELLRRSADDPALATGYLAGQPRQERLDVGYATIRSLDVPPAERSRLTLPDVDAALERLTTVGGAGSKAARRTILTDLLTQATADEQRFLYGLILGELRQGALAGIVAQGVAAAAEVPEAAIRRAVMLAGDLATVAAAACQGGEDALARFRLTLFQPVHPMLAETATSVAEAAAAFAEAAVEWKLDGTRVQVHKRGGEVRVYTRNLRDATARSPETVAVARALPCEEAILDGEDLAVRADGRPEAFQDTMRVDARRQPFFFDLLHLDGDDLLDEPLRTRRAALERLVPPANLVPVGGLDQAIAAGHEGVMVKDCDSPYEAGRRGAAWRKVKPVKTLDLVVLAVEWGSGRRRGWLSNIHLGARDGDGFVMLGKTFKGMTDQTLEWQTERFLALETHRDDYTVYVRPEQVVEIAFDGLQRSRRYPGGFALRFARVKRYRTDKTAAEADTIDAVRALAGAQT